MPKSDLPFGSEFSPNQIDLPQVLTLVAKHSGDKAAFEDVIRNTFFKDNNTNERNKRKLAMNLRLSLKAYQIIDNDMVFTDFGASLYQLRDTTDKLYAELATHILFHLNGLTLVQCVEWLQERGIHFPRGGKHPSMM